MHAISCPSLPWKTRRYDGIVNTWVRGKSGAKVDVHFRESHSVNNRIFAINRTKIKVPPDV